MLFKIAAAASVGGLIFYCRNCYVDSKKVLNNGQHVVIVGGGYGGTKVASKLKGRGNFTLIDSKDSLHHNMAALRAAVVPGFVDKTYIYYEPTFGDNFHQGKVTGVDTNLKQVKVEGEEPISYTQLVIATGSSGPFPGKNAIDLPTPKLMEKYKDFTTVVSKAENIIIIGGGAVGLELAGDIRDEHKDKKITVLHNTDVLINSALLPKAQEKLREKLKQKNIEVVYNEYVSNLSDIPTHQATKDIEVKTRSGKVFNGDLVIPCIGLYVNKEAYANDLGDSMNKKGQLKVDENLQVLGTPDVFAIGDCNDYDVLKVAYEANEQGSHMFENLVKIGKDEKITPYKPGNLKMVIPIGKDGGVVQNGSKVSGDFLAKMIKGKDVFVKFAWKEMSQTPPK